MACCEKKKKKEAEKEKEGRKKKATTDILEVWPVTVREMIPRKGKRSDGNSNHGKGETIAKSRTDAAIVRKKEKIEGRERSLSATLRRYIGKEDRKKNCPYSSLPIRGKQTRISGGGVF